MSHKKNGLNRREFLKVSSLTGLGALIPALPMLSVPGKPVVSIASDKVQTRTFGRNKIPVSMLSLGGMFDIPNNLVILKKALDYGVNYWDTANSYEGGNSELGIGMYFEKFPETRKKVFLVTKTGRTDPEGMTKLLNLSLERMKTDYIDLYFLHGKNVSELTPEVKAWADKMKAQKKIHNIGFSSHSNMANNLSAAAKLGWVDGIMFAYNFRLMNDDAMKSAVEACYKAGIGLTAMKTQGGGPLKTDPNAELNMATKFLQKGYTPQQAKMKAVWQNPMISAICSQMPNLTILNANVAAALDKTELKTSELHALEKYADATCSSYCAGCSHLCEAAVNKAVPVADVMRFMMYYHSYQNAELARSCYAELPGEVKELLHRVDYSNAEAVCPNKLVISQIIKDATRLLG